MSMQELQQVDQPGILGSGAWAVLVLLIIALFGFILFVTLTLM